MDTATETKSAGVKFLEAHEQALNELATAKMMVDDQHKEIQLLDAKNKMLADQLAQASTDRNKYLQYAFELSAQLQFIVAGSARALLIANGIRTAISMQSSNIPDVPGADVAELEGILHRIGVNNDAADAAKLNDPSISDATKNLLGMK